MSDLSVRTWDGELDRLDLYEVIIQQEEVKVEVEVPVEIDDRYSILPGRTGPRLYCTTCRLFVRNNDMGGQLREMLKEAQEHERSAHNG